MLAGTSTRAAAPADRVAPTAHVPGVAPAAIAATSDLSTARRARSPQVSAPCKKRRVCVLAATCRGRCVAACCRCRRRAARASRPRHPRLTPTRLPHCRRSQRRRSTVAERRVRAAVRAAERPGRVPTATARSRRRSAWAAAPPARSAACMRRALRSRLPARPPDGRLTGVVCAPACGAISRLRDRRCLERLAAPRQLWKGWGRSGGGTRSRHGQPRCRGCICGAVMVARTR